MPRKDPQRCSTIRDRVDKWEKYWTLNRSLYYEWIDFVMGDQWREDESKLFERYNKIPLVFNKLGVLMNHLLGDQIQNSPNLVILPDDDVPVEQATVRSALVKNIVLNSDTASVFNDSFGQAIVGGYSAFRVGTRYLHDESFDQEIMYEGFDDPNRCYWGIEAKHKCKVDSMTSGFRVRVSRKWFRDQYGEDIEKQIGSSAITEDSTMAFADNDSITMVYDYEREPAKGKIYQMSNGMVINDEQYKQLRKEKVNGKKYLFFHDEPLTVFNDREVIRYKTEHTLIAGDFVLDETEFPASLSPVHFVDQKSYFTKAGQQITRSFFKDVKDAQKYLNYLATQSAYMMKISRYDQFIMPRKCAASPDAQQQWRDPSVVNGALYYDETPSGAKPEQLKPPELSQSLTLQYERTLVDIQSGTGMYDAQLGDVDDRVSGIGMKRRNERGTKNTQMPRDSINRAIWTSGEIVNEMIPSIYDTQRKLKLSMHDSESQTVEINKPADEYGIQTENDMTKGRYKIRIKPGPSYEGQKELALESLQSVLAADKAGQVFPMIADLYAENLPLDNSLELRNRLRTLVPPEIIEAGKSGKPMQKKEPQPDPMVMLKQQELQQKAQSAQLEHQRKVKELELKQSEIQRKAMETHQNMTMEWQDIEAKKEEAAAALQGEILRYQAEMQRVQADLQVNHSQNLIKMLVHTGQIHHEKDMQVKDHAHEKSIKPTQPKKDNG
jgi:hypothetical protein